MKLIMNRVNRRRALLLLVDILLLLAATVVARLVIYPKALFNWASVLTLWGILTGINLIYGAVLNTYAPIWRYAGAKELFRFVNTYLFSCVTCVLFKHVFRLDLSTGFILASSVAGAFLAAYFRTVYKFLFNSKKHAPEHPGEVRRPIAIIGAGEAGSALAKELAGNSNAPYTVWGFFDDDLNKIGKSICGAKVLGEISDLPAVVANSPVKDLVLAMPSIPIERRREIVSLCRTLPCRLMIMPEIVHSIESEENRLTKAMRYVNTEDLLGRSAITFKENEMAEFLHKKTVLVTGGGGSIGSELCRQIAGAGANELIIFDVNENSSYMLQKEIEQRINGSLKTVVEIGSVTDSDRVRDVFRRYKPQVVFHAAAHKHVPLMEQCPYEAVWNNVFGTQNVIRVAADAGVEKFVFISTDKAVNPTSIMGATKRYCEEMIRAFSQTQGICTCFVSVRFGNVLGSNGSVIPIFKEQIAHGGPVTITDKRITRYFMTISEAVGLVLKSGAMAKSSETYILDMGEPVKIIDLAESLIRQMNLEPYRDVQIVEIGLRPGEKLYEELLVNDEQHTATKETKIFIECNANTMEWGVVQRQLEKLYTAVKDTDSRAAVSLMRQFVPNYLDANDVNEVIAESLGSSAKTERESV